MSDYLIDTHAFLWFAAADRRLPDHLRAIIESPENRVAVSVASFWEMAIKSTIGKLVLSTNVVALEGRAIDHGIDVVSITVPIVHQTTFLPLHHRDPFDRLLAATALATSSSLISADSIFDNYGVQRIW